MPISTAARVDLNESMLNLPPKTMKMMLTQVFHSSIAQLKHRYWKLLAAVAVRPAFIGSHKVNRARMDLKLRTFFSS